MDSLAEMPRTSVSPPMSSVRKMTEKGIGRPVQPVWELSLRLRDSLADYAYLTACECLELLKQQETQQQTVEALAQIEQALQAFEYEQAQELLSALYPEETE